MPVTICLCNRWVGQLKWVHGSNCNLFLPSAGAISTWPLIRGDLQGSKVALAEAKEGPGPIKCPLLQYPLYLHWLACSIDPLSPFQIYILYIDIYPSTDNWLITFDSSVSRDNDQEEKTNQPSYSY